MDFIQQLGQARSQQYYGAEDGHLLPKFDL
jgi:hypothetical protein